MLLGCADQKPANEGEFKRWFNIEENGYVKSKQIGSILFNLRQQPKELMALRELRGVSDLAKRDSIIKTYEGSMYYVLEMKWQKEEGSSEQPLKGMVQNYDEYKSLLEQLAFNIGTNVNLEIGGKEIVPSIAHFEQAYEISNSNRFIFSFPVVEDQQKEEARFVFRDQYFGTGVQKFKFKNQKEVPVVPLF